MFRCARALCGADCDIQAIARQLPQGPLTKSLPLPNTLSYVCPLSVSLKDAESILQADLADLDLSSPRQGTGFLVFASNISWTRSARRAKLRSEEQAGEVTDLICEVILQDYEGGADSDMQKPVEFVCVWHRGTQRQHFESLFSHIIRKLAAGAPNNDKME